MLTLCSPMLALEMLSPIAVTETAEVGRGWERGGEGVGTARSAVGGARLYNLRLPPKASGKDTGSGSWAGARIEGLPPMPPTPKSTLHEERRQIYDMNYVYNVYNHIYTVFR